MWSPRTWRRDCSPSRRSSWWPARGPQADAAAARLALRAHAPLLLTAVRPGHSAPGGVATTAFRTAGTTGATAVVSAALRARIRDLDPRVVLAVGVAANVLRAQLPGIRVVTDPAMLPATKPPALLGHLALLVHAGDTDAATLAAVTTARVAGAQVIAVHGTDPRTDPAAIAALSAIRPRQVLAIGSGFGPAARLASRIVVAQTGVQLPGGGRVLFPGHLLVALYGHPGTPSLGALGQQDLQASIARAQNEAAAYRKLTRVKVIPAFEIIATVAEGSPGPDGDYSYQTPVAVLRPWILAAEAAGMYVILDLQAGRASLLAQAQSYQSLLELPGVGLALDPEWKLAPGQLPLRQIGGVSSSQVNSVIAWLAALTARYRLPQKLSCCTSSAVDDPRRAPTRHPVRRPGDPHPHGRAGDPGRQAADLGHDHPGRPAAGVLRVEEFLRQGPSDAEPAADDRQDPAAFHDLVPVTAPAPSRPRNHRASGAPVLSP